MSELSLENFSPEQKKRLGYLEGREDLFESKVLKIDSDNTEKECNETSKKILVISRNPGSANALVPVMEILYQDKSMEIVALTDGRAQEIIQKKFPTKDITPRGMVLESDMVIGKPNVMVTDASTEKGLELYGSATYSESPIVLIEDYYTSSYDYLKSLKERNLPMPVKICVIDEEAKALMIEKFPDLIDRIEVTGQPAFDKFAKENTEQLSLETKDRLGLKSQDKLVSFMAMANMTEEVASKLAQEIKKVANDFYFAFRIHPRDNTPFEKYDEIFRQAGIKTIDTRQFSTDEIGAASDLVVTTWSTEGLHGIYRRKPTIHITDSKLQEIPSNLKLPLPPVKLGASVGINNSQELSAAMIKLLDPKNTANATLKENMERYYPRDGKNAERVANITRKVIEYRKNL